MNKLIVLLAALLVSLSFTVIADSHKGKVVASGEFQGASDHITTGGVTIKQTADGFIVELAEDFSLDGAPDPKLGFGKNGYDEATTFAPLQSKTGAQTYTIPANIDVSNYNEFYIWCEQFSVPLGIAKLK